MEIKEKEKVLSEFKAVEESGLDVKEKTEEYQNYVQISPDKRIQMHLAWFTMILLIIFLTIPCIFFAYERITFDQLKDFLTTIMALLGTITGAVWGYYFNSIKN